MPKTIEKPSTVQGREKEVSREEIEREAYFGWVQRGCPCDDPLTDWVEAEKKLTVKEDWTNN